MVQSVTEQVLFDELWMSVDTKQALRFVLSLTNPGPLRPQELPVGQGDEVDEAGHKTGPAACFEPAESERHAGREVEAEWAHYKTLG